MFTVRDSVANTSGNKVTLYPYAYVARDGVPLEDKSHTWLLHEGFVGVADGSLKDSSYSDFKDDKPPQTFTSTGGWLGITDKYWMAAVIPPQKAAFDGTYRAAPGSSEHSKSFQADYRLPPETIAPGKTVSLTQHLFAGAKVVQTLNNYEAKLGITRFDLAIDWGWFWFFTKPIFWLLDTFYRWIGNFGIAILLLTVTIKAAFFPLANASFKSMSKMKKLQPEMEPDQGTLRRRQGAPAAGDDGVLQAREGQSGLGLPAHADPDAGVLLALQGALRHHRDAPRALLSAGSTICRAPDPTSILNLFGLLPYHIPLFIPAFLSIGIWPVLMGFTQFLSTKMNPTPADPVQAKMFTFMPVIFTFMMAGFPAGLVIYWTWNNLLTAAQQYVVMRRQGVEVHLFENLKLRGLMNRLTGTKTDG